LIDEEMEREPETVKAEIEEMVKNYPHLVIEVITEHAEEITKNVESKILFELKDALIDEEELEKLGII